MANLTVWKFEDSAGAESALTTLRDLASENDIILIDAAVVTWPQGKKKPKTRHANNLTASAALDGAVWGMLMGFIFFVPFFGMAMGAVMGGLAGKLSDYGIGEDFIKEVRAKVTEGTSALFVLSGAATEDKIHEAFADTKMELIQSNLSEAQEAELRENFGEHATADN
jgi:uncharacterized membrane protein